jgi:hypothetical protein
MTSTQPFSQYLTTEILRVTSLTHRSDIRMSHACGTSCGTGTTHTCRAGATQVFEVNPEAVDEGKSTIPALLSQGRSSALSPQTQVPGRGIPPSKPSPEEKSLPHADEALEALGGADEALARTWEAMQLSPDVADSSFRGVLRCVVNRAPGAAIHENLSLAVKQLQAWGLNIAPQILAAYERLTQDARSPNGTGSLRSGENPIPEGRLCQ